ncbi:LRRC72 [Symbiodinium pilosum]|uniref:LRRC72 protein n=1 Tax=Symbiodinium pilosum TaxID=2952 RepID=A0A812NIJ3_SYMPI|nr:LRRC72 [Symbiodinium pilosum]
MELDPYQCIAKKNRKYASECTEVHLANLGAESISKKFEHFHSLEVVWFQGNSLSRVENLETNFRIREVYIQNNRLVSLAGLKSFKFLRVLLASGNQLRNLDKQLALLSRFPFLKKLELFDNPVAEEPDYRLRLIYHVPQVELLDQHTVKGAERLRADEVVPNLDKVSAAKVEKPRPKGHQFSLLERQCIHEARSIQERRRQEEELSMSKSFHVAVDKDAPPDCKVFKANRDRWMDPRKKIVHETLRPTPWECHEMRGLIEERAGKKELTKEDVAALAKDLGQSGIEEVGRFLKSPAAVFEEVMEQDAVEAGMTALARSLKFHTESKGKVKPVPHPLDKLMQDASATLPVSEVITWLLRLDWPRFEDDLLDRRIEKLFEDIRRAEFAGDKETVGKLRTHASRLEGAKTLKEHVELNRKEIVQAAPKARVDIFPQTFIRGKRQIDEATGRIVLKVGMDTRSTSMGTMTVAR